MSQAMDPIGAAPEIRTVRFLTLLFGAILAPLFWTGQMLLGYAITAYVCYPGDHPVQVSFGRTIFDAMLVFDIVALMACAAGGVVSWRSWRSIRPLHGPSGRPQAAGGRNRFLAIWGLMSSLWFFFGILFNTIASLMVTPCVN